MKDGPDPGADARPAQEPGTGRRLASFVILSLVLLGLSLFTPARSWFSVERIQAVSEGMGFWGPAAIFLFGLLSPLLFLPRWPIAVVCGLLYGVGWGSLLATTASLAGAWLHFGVARTLLAPASARLLQRHGWENLRIPKNRWFAVLFFLRAFPLSNFVATNLLAGSLAIPLRIYLTASFFGMIPSTLMYAAWGKLAKERSAGFYTVALASLAFIVVGTLLAQRYFVPWFRRQRADVNEGPGTEE